MGVITIRVPDALHAALRREAHERCTSLNKLCIAKVRNDLNRTQVNRDGHLLEAAVTPGAAPGAVAWPGGNIPGMPNKLPPTGRTGDDTAHPCTVPGVVCKWREVHVQPQGILRYVCKAPGGTPCPYAPDHPNAQVQGGQAGQGGPVTPVTSSDIPRHPVTGEKQGVTPGMVAGTVRADATGLRRLMDAAMDQAAAAGRGPCRGCRAAWRDGSCGLCPGPGYMMDPPPAVPPGTDEDLGDPVPPSDHP